MELIAQGKRIGIRNLTLDDVPVFARWWNDGELMAAVGFSKGLGVTEAELERRFAEEVNDPDSKRHARLYVIVDLENDYKPLGGSLWAA